MPSVFDFPASLGTTWL